MEQIKGLTGLANLGNTCFMNATLQCLSHSNKLNNLLDKNDYRKKLNKKPESLILIEWDKLRQMMWSENCVISPGGFLAAIQKVASVKKKVIFTGFAQNDMPEFLQFIIFCFHEAILREVHMNIKGNVITETDKLAEKCFTMMKAMYKKEYSEILSMFYGIHVSKLSSLDGEVITITPEPYCMLSLPIPKDMDSPSLLDCFKLYIGEEQLDGENMYYNEEKKEKQVVNKCIQFWNFPELMIIYLKRFTNNLKKDGRVVNFPLEDFDISELVIGYDNKSYIYDLYAVCNHSGSIMGGHYTAYVKVSNGEWYHFNDTQVSKVSKELIKTPKAYCLFYCKKKPTK